MSEPKEKLFDAIPGLKKEEALAGLKDTLLKAKPDGKVPVGIDETLDVVDFATAFANAIIYSFEDGKLTLGDFGHAIKPIMKAPAAFSGLSQVPDELADLDEVERTAIIEKVKESLDVSSDKAMTIVEKALVWAYATYDLVEEIITD